MKHIYEYLNKNHEWSNDLDIIIRGEKVIVKYTLIIDKEKRVTIAEDKDIDLAEEKALKRALIAHNIEIPQQENKSENKPTREVKQTKEEKSTEETKEEKPVEEKPAENKVHSLVANGFLRQDQFDFFIEFKEKGCKGIDDCFELTVKNFGEYNNYPQIQTKQQLITAGKDVVDKFIEWVCKYHVEYGNYQGDTFEDEHTQPKKKTTQEGEGQKQPNPLVLSGKITQEQIDFLNQAQKDFNITTDDEFTNLLINWSEFGGYETIKTKKQLLNAGITVIGKFITFLKETYHVHQNKTIKMPDLDI